MKTRFRKWAPPTLALALAGLVLLGTAPKAHATLTLVAVETGGPTLVAQDGAAAGVVINAGALGILVTTVADSLDGVDGNLGLGGLAGIPFGDFQVAGSTSTSNSPGTSTLAQLISSSLSVTNTTAVSHEITLQISDNGYTSPSNPLFGATAGGTFNVAPGATTVNGDSAHALAFANFANTLFGTGLTVQDFTFSTDTTNLTTASYANNVPNSILGPGTVPYSMTVELVFTVAGHNILSSRSDAETAIAAVPEPATLALAFSALPMIGLAAWRRRKSA